MINYSITMRSVNCNLIDINEAKKNNEQPSQADLLCATTLRGNPPAWEHTPVRIRLCWAKKKALAKTAKAFI